MSAGMGEQSVEIDVLAVGQEVLTELMMKWGCGRGDQTVDHPDAPYLCRSTAHETSYWGNHCGFAGDAASSALIPLQNAVYRQRTPPEASTP